VRAAEDFFARYPAPARDLLEGVLIAAAAALLQRARVVAPRELHEGLAQFVEGKRSQTRLGDEGRRALADGRIRGVPPFYMASLGLMEDL